MNQNTVTDDCENLDKDKRIHHSFKKFANINSEYGVAAAIEARRIAEKYDKDFLDCEDLVKIMGVGRNNIRQMLNNDSFPTVEIGNRKVVSVIAFTVWSMQNGEYF